MVETVNNQLIITSFNKYMATERTETIFLHVSFMQFFLEENYVLCKCYASYTKSYCMKYLTIVLQMELPLNVKNSKVSEFMS